VGVNKTQVISWQRIGSSRGMQQNQKRANLNIRQRKQIHVIQASKEEREFWVYILVKASKRTITIKK
jgi:hypothetical protein